MFKDILTNKKKLTYVIIGAVLIIAVITGITIFALKSVNDNKKEEVVVTKTTADEAKAKAIEAIKNNDKPKSVTELKEANEQYQELKDTNNVVDTRAMLCIQGQTEYCKPITE